MSNEGVNKSRRRFLLATTSVVGAVGVGLAAVPFLSSWRPSERAKAIGAPVELDISKLEPGQIIKGQWRGQTIGIVRRSQAMLDTLPNLTESLRDPDSDNPEQQPEYARNEYRSANPEFLVLSMNCTHLGCVPELIPQVGPQPFDELWQGGFYCPCHKSRFDLAGRVYKNVPAPTNLLVPPYSFLDENTIMIGVNPEGAA